MLRHRHRVYQEAQRANPTRWSRHTRNWTPIDHVWLNPPKEHALTPDPVVAQAASQSGQVVDKHGCLYLEMRKALGGEGLHFRFTESSGIFILI